ncbi:T9SS type A sorting domain-containing protein [Psychroserpens sp. SPM9]|uniref:T9SS type A sorting domain-containing protein n=1 Tax=Psychroserpens sp. SPM9 TaxID=2975598 RepID=UPI0021A34FA9|nr:T9SS type A sorting domain-containing protein [Psychroserpens sp. SPM9]MDG5492120.1 T9SS type A sorting domain-containing protein [Psychroserpens sp. SPM9]
MKTKLLLASLLLTSALATSQVMANQVADFEDGTTQTWQKGAAAPPEEQPMNVATGGPAGADDNYLEFSSNGIPDTPSSKMVIFSSGASSPWTSNYTSEGIVAIKMDVNVSINDLNMRVAFQGSGTRICTTNAVAVAAGSGWTTITIPISPSDFTVIQGSLTPAGVLANVQVMRILSSEVPAWGTNVTEVEATLGLDNIIASTTLSTEEFNTQNEFEISPNPATSKLNIKLAQTLNNANVVVYNVLGKKVYAKSLSAMTSSIDVSNWNSGVYLVRVSTDKQTLTKRFVKQ